MSIERIDEQGNSYKDIGLPDPLGTYLTEAEARGMALAILGHFAPHEIPDSDNYYFFKGKHGN